VLVVAAAALAIGLAVVVFVTSGSQSVESGDMSAAVSSRDGGHASFRGLEVVIPPGGVQGPATLSLHRVPAPGQPQRVRGEVFSVILTRSLLRPAVMRFHAGAGTDVTPAWWNGRGWVPVAGLPDRTRGVITIQTAHFSVWSTVHADQITHAVGGATASVAQFLNYRAKPPKCAGPNDHAHVELGGEPTDDRPLLACVERGGSGLYDVHVVNNRSFMTLVKLPTGSRGELMANGGASTRVLATALNAARRASSFDSLAVPAGFDLKVSVGYTTEPIVITSSSDPATTAWGIILDTAASVGDASELVKVVIDCGAVAANQVARRAGIGDAAKAVAAKLGTDCQSFKELKRIAPKKAKKLVNLLGKIKLVVPILEGTVRKLRPIETDGRVTVTFPQFRPLPAARPPTPPPAPVNRNGPCGAIDVVTLGVHEHVAVNVVGFTDASVPSCAEATSVIRDERAGKTSNVHHDIGSATSTEQVGRWLCTTINMSPLVTCTLAGHPGQITGRISGG
jgi:hypothetical protein